MFCFLRSVPLYKNLEFNSFLSIQSVGVNLFGQLLMCQVLENINYQSFLEKRMKVLNERKALVKKLLNEACINCLHEVQGGMNFYVDLKQDSTKYVSKLLTKHKIAFIPGYLFEGKPSNYARMGFGAAGKEEIMKGIKVLSQLL